MRGLTWTIKNWLVLLVGVATLALVSCSEETVDNIERDTALNIIRANKWFDVVKTTSVAGQADVTEVLVGDGENLEFRSNGYAYVYGANGSTESYPYHMPSNKKMVFDGVEYDVQENIIQTVARFTLVNTTSGITTTITFRRR
ncbi:hypothetical protein BC792_11845 [Sphingobacterium allocomposti]|uniref:Lipocalin-like protein n=2 Tax=Sphingobacterium allocomposti TaxID=415956 RepID=A0A5S5D8Z0_9SPHI|nr:hypothetical protein BC792_11845 [Sphingobacterium composti Yoo et al. 2007 non Ten et al. 2007]